MYAIVKSGGKQYKVAQGQILRVETIPGDIGSEITFNDVLMVSTGDTVSVGNPVMTDAAVTGRIVEQGRSKKVLVFKYKRRKRYRRTRGHRQNYTAVQIDSIQA